MQQLFQAINRGKYKIYKTIEFFTYFHYSEPILESKGMRAIFQKKGKKFFKKDKIFKNLGKNVQNFKIF